MTEQAKKDARDLWLPLGTVIAILICFFYVVQAWASQSGKIESQEQRITKLEIAVQGIASALDQVKETNIALKVGVDNLSSRVYDIGKDVKDIRTAVK